MNDKLSACKDCGIFYPIPNGVLDSEFCDECRVDCHDDEVSPYAAQIASMTVSTDLSREEIWELGRTPYYRHVDFPAEILCEFELVAGSNNQLVKATEDALEYDTKKYENTYTFEIVDGKTKLKDCYEREQLCQKTNKKISWMSWVKKQLRKLRLMKK